MRASASPMKRTRPAARSSSPPTVSWIVPSALSDSALMVKSRRSASRAKSRPNLTLAHRPSVSTSSRSVVVSIGRPSTMIVTVPCLTPVSATLNPAARARRIASPGTAVVARSKSSAASPSARSRTAPPTSRVSSPEPLSAASARASGPSLKMVRSLSFPWLRPGTAVIRSGRERGRHSRYAPGCTRRGLEARRRSSR